MNNYILTKTTNSKYKKKDVQLQELTEFSEHVFYEYDQMQIMEKHSEVDTEEYPLICLNTANNTYTEITNKEELKIVFAKLITKEFKKNPLIANLFSAITNKEINEWDKGLGYLTEYQIDQINHAKRITEKDILLHYKGFGFDFIKETKRVVDNEEGCLESIEHLDDLTQRIITHQKAKKYAQKIYSNKYRFLKDENTIKILETIVDEKIDLTELRDKFAKKLARYETSDESNEALSKFLSNYIGWNKEKQKEYIEKNDAVIICDKDELLVVKIENYKQSKNLGSNQWCISYSPTEFNNYKDANNMYFIYDFSKLPEDNLSMIGITMNMNGEIEDGHVKNDDFLSEYIKDYNSKDSYIKKMLPNSIPPKDFAKNLMTSSFRSREDKFENVFYDLHSMFLRNKEKDYKQLDKIVDGILDYLEENDEKINVEVKTFFYFTKIKDDIQNYIYKKDLNKKLNKIAERFSQFENKDFNPYKIIESEDYVFFKILIEKDKLSEKYLDKYITNADKITNVSAKKSIYKLITEKAKEYPIGISDYKKRELRKITDKLFTKTSLRP